MTFSAVIEAVRNIFGANGVVARFLPPLLICCTAVRRPGVSSAMIASMVIESNRQNGIPTGPNPDGSANLINKHDYGLVKCVVDSLLKNMVIQVGIPAGSLVIQSEGGNAGGPVISIGTNKTDTLAFGIPCI